MTCGDILASVKLSMAITSEAYDFELLDLIAAAAADLKSNGINADVLMEDDKSDALVLQAIKTYCRLHFQSPADYDRLLAAYEEQKGHMRGCSGYTTWPSEVTSNGES